MNGLNVICITGKRGAGDALSEFTEKAGRPFNFYTVPAVYDSPVRYGIRQAHSNALALSRTLEGLSIIVEDDVELTSMESIDHFLFELNLAKNEGSDILLGGASHFKGVLAPVSQLSGMFFYAVLNPSVTFDHCPKNCHIDNWLADTYKVAVCQPMVAVTRAGWSEHSRTEVDYSAMFERYPILR
jgi:hypothetical protein